MKEEKEETLKEGDKVLVVDYYKEPQYEAVVLGVTQNAVLVEYTGHFGRKTKYLEKRCDVEKFISPPQR